MTRILITGPESSGKTTLAMQLAEELGGRYWPEYARAWLMAQDGVYTPTDLDIMLGEQEMERQFALFQPYNLPQVFDTGPETFYTWSLIKYGSVSPHIKARCLSTYYDLCLLLAPDLPWEEDPLRESPDQEERMLIFRTYAGRMHQWGWRFAIINGDQRLEQAMNVIQAAYFK
ncbi:MAG: ATP-binding protein [Bacteroidota bacterium]